MTATMTRVQAPNGRLHGRENTAMALWWVEGVTYTDDERALQRFRRNEAFELSTAPAAGQERVDWLNAHGAYQAAVAQMQAEAAGMGCFPDASALQDAAGPARSNYQAGRS